MTVTIEAIEAYLSDHPEAVLSLKLKSTEGSNTISFAERRAARRASVTAKASEAITDAEEPQVPDCFFEFVQAPSSKTSVQATAIQTSASATATASEATAGEESVTEMACKDLEKSEDQDSEASSFGPVVPERLSHKARQTSCSVGICVCGWRA